MRLYHQHKQYIHVTGMTVTSFSSLLQKLIVATANLCQIAINQKLLCTFEKWCKFEVALEENHLKQVLPIYNSNGNMRHDKTYKILSRTWQHNSTLISIQLLKKTQFLRGTDTSKSIKIHSPHHCIIL